MQACIDAFIRGMEETIYELHVKYYIDQQGLGLGLDSGADGEDTLGDRMLHTAAIYGNPWPEEHENNILQLIKQIGTHDQSDQMQLLETLWETYATYKSEVDETIKSLRTAVSILLPADMVETLNATLDEFEENQKDDRIILRKQFNDIVTLRTTQLKEGSKAEIYTRHSNRLPENLHSLVAEHVGGVDHGTFAELRKEAQKAREAWWADQREAQDAGKRGSKRHRTGNTLVPAFGVLRF